ncbi:MAG: hypothetical protein KDA80_15320, partial [Planctomycetaceae bacterium]|nr:hypothetical protein [Planctomycetaceae bacterium]
LHSHGRRESGGVQRYVVCEKLPVSGHNDLVLLLEFWGRIPHASEKENGSSQGGTWWSQSQIRDGLSRGKLI